MKKKPNWAVSLQKARQKKNLTQKQLSNLINVTESAVIKYENGINFPSFNTLLLICNVLNISAYTLFSDTLEYLASLDYEYRKLKNFINSSNYLQFKITDDYALMDSSYYDEVLRATVPDCYSSVDDCIITEKNNTKNNFAINKEKLLTNSYLIKQMLMKEYANKLNEFLKKEIKGQQKQKPD